ncbi:Oxoglutarate dehydrogenase inhibitor [Planctomycetes bacterium Pla163]|uniref:Oxoglutarate dehydrogenase inhibitor n=1 Tax=Rohdeia mirabilis TaxID=2528008 RepID=A0A518CXB8_9BACT|nr:Oxoglutarate dehydrogenase inhibitor [Planctomycetes bacterium Pla163]
MSQRLALRFLSGSHEGESFPITGGGLTIGRRPANDVALDDGSVSGAHAKLTVEDGDLWVEDLGSTNGTRVGGRKVERMSLLAGDELSFGSVRARVVEEEVSSAPAPASASPFFEDDDEISLEEPDDVPAAAPSMPARSASEPAPSMPSAAAAPAPRPAPQSAPAARAPRPAPVAPALELDDDDGTIEADLDAFDRRQKGSKAVTLAVVAVLVIGAGVGGWLAFGQGGGSDEDDQQVVAVPAIEGNLLGADFSFEQPVSAAAWESFGEAPAVLSRGRGGALSGRSGLYGSFGSEAGTEVEAGQVDWAAEMSERVRVRVGQVLTGTADFAVEGDGWVRAGILFETDAGVDGRGNVLWGPPGRGADGSVATAAMVPTGVTGARLVLAAGGNATVSIDDAAVVLGAELPGPGEVGELEVATTGPAASAGTVVLARSDRALVVVRAARDASAHAAGHVLAVERASDGAPRIALRLGAARGATERRLHLEIPAATGDVARRIAVVAGGDYRAFGAEFEVEDATQLLVGRGLELVRFEFDAPVTVRGRRDEFGALVDVQLGALESVGVQLAFTAERGEAATLAAATRRAGKEGRLGDALAGWEQVLSRFGFQDDLVDEAEATVGSLTTQGRQELDALTQDVVRAAFFALPGVYDECAARARDLRDRYTAASGATNPVREGANELLERIASERTALVEAIDATEPDRSSAILEFLNRTGQEPLVERLTSDAAPGSDGR